MPVAPLIANDISSVSTITHDSHFAWQAQYLVMCDADAWCSARCKLQMTLQSSTGVVLCSTE